MRSGAGTATVPVPVGTPMDGYGSRTGVSTGTLRPLEANALVLDVDGASIVLITVDAVGIDASVVRRIRASIGDHMPICPDHVLVCASHTHSGPKGLRANDGGPTHQAVVDAYVSSVVTAVRAAFASRQAAAVLLWNGRPEGVASNRREADSLVDAAATLIAVNDPAGNPIARIWHFACHATVLGPSNTLVSPDLPGDVRALLRKHTRPDLPVLYLPGAGGDVSTRFTRREQTPAELSRLAQLVVDSWRTASEPVHLRAPRAWTQTIPLPAARDSDVETIEDRLARSVAQLAVLPEDAPERRGRETTVQGLQRRLGRARAADRPEVLLAELQAITLGDLAIAALPGEPMSATGSKLRELSGYPVTLTVGYAGGYIGYLPTADVKTGYEAEVALVEPGGVEVAVEWFANRLGRDGFQ